MKRLRGIMKMKLPSLIKKCKLLPRYSVILIFARKSKLLLFFIVKITVIRFIHLACNTTSSMAIGDDEEEGGDGENEAGSKLFLKRKQTNRAR